MSDRRLCKDCKWFMGLECGHPIVGQFALVIYEYMADRTEAPGASTEISKMRMGPCGLDGTLWEAAT